MILDEDSFSGMEGKGDAQRTTHQTVQKQTRGLDVSIVRTPCSKLRKPSTLRLWDHVSSSSSSKVYYIPKLGTGSLMRAIRGVSCLVLHVRT